MKNPYIDFGAQLKTSLDYIIANLPVSPTFEDLNQQLVNSYYTLSPTGDNPLDLLMPVLKTVLPNVYNGYEAFSREPLAIRTGNQNGHEGPTLSAKSYQLIAFTNNKYSTEQQHFINKITESILIAPVLQMGEILSRLEEEVVQSGLNFEQQTPLLLALALGKASSEYWMNQITVFAAWGPYLNAESFLNYANLPHWVNATAVGSLLAYGLVRPPQIGFADIYISTVAATGLVAGKVVFNWIGAN